MQPETKSAPAGKATLPKSTRAAIGNSSAAKLEPKPKTTPTHEEIARRAYEIYIARGQAHGRDCDDWLQAERELRTVGLRNN